MPRFRKLSVDWCTHIKLDAATLEQSSHRKNEQPGNCTCDVCAEYFYWETISLRTVENDPDFIFYKPKLIQEQTKIQGVDGCKCHRPRCHAHQFDLFWEEHQDLVKENSKLIDDWYFTICLQQQLQDVEELRERHSNFLKRLSDAGIYKSHQTCCGLDFSSLSATDGGHHATPREIHIALIERVEKWLGQSGWNLRNQ